MITLKFATPYGAAVGLTAYQIAQWVPGIEAATNGRVKIEMYEGGALLGTADMIDGTIAGITDIGFTHIQYSPGVFPVTEALTLPLGVTSPWVGTQLSFDFIEQFKPKEWDRLKLLSLMSSGPSGLFTKKPVRTLEDLKGMIIRAPGPIGDVMDALGAVPRPIPYPEIYDAISKGVIDGVDISTQVLEDSKVAEVVDYVTFIWPIAHPYTFYYVMNLDTWNKLPADIQIIFDEFTKESMLRDAGVNDDEDFEGVEFARELGVEFIDLSPAEAARWIQAVEPVIEDYVETMVAAGWTETEVRGWIKFISERIDYWTAKSLELGLKSAAGPIESRR